PATSLAATSLLETSADELSIDGASWSRLAGFRLMESESDILCRKFLSTIFRRWHAILTLVQRPLTLPQAGRIMQGVGSMPWSTSSENIPCPVGAANWRRNRNRVASDAAKKYLPTPSLRLKSSEPRTLNPP